MADEHTMGWSVEGPASPTHPGNLDQALDSLGVPAADSSSPSAGCGGDSAADGELAPEPLLLRRPAVAPTRWLGCGVKRDVAEVAADLQLFSAAAAAAAAAAEAVPAAVADRRLRVRIVPLPSWLDGHADASAPPYDLAHSTVVLIDVQRMTTTLTTALAEGAAAVRVFAQVDEVVSVRGPLCPCLSGGRVDCDLAMACASAT
jgi:hypothetical protein